MSIINRPPEMAKREYELQEPIAVAVDKDATFIQSTPDHVVNSALKIVIWRDVEFRRCERALGKGQNFSRGWRGTSIRKQMPQKHRAGWSSRNETFSRASRSWVLYL
jgi:hypothetical protein